MTARDSSDGSLASNVVGFLQGEFAAEFRRTIAAHTTEALTRKARAGQVTGGRCFGYRNVRDASGVRREIEPAEAATVRRIFELRALGVGLVGIAKRLNQEGATCPRPQRGRPAGWAPSSIREVLFRTAYRGELTWNKSKKRDASGEARQSPRPDSEWIHVNAPHLRIVEDALFEAAHREMDQQRARSCGPSSYHGPKKAKTEYLLTGLLRCGVCNAGMEIRRQRHGNSRELILHCSAFRRKGLTVCANNKTVLVEDAERVILDTLTTTLLNPDVMKLAIAGAKQRLESGDTSHEIADEIRKLDAELSRLSEAIAAGGDVPTLVQAIQERERRRQELRLQVRTTRQPKAEAASIEVELRQALESWQILLRNSTHGRTLLRLLVVDRFAMTPTPQGYVFSGTGTVEKCLSGTFAFAPASRKARTSKSSNDLAVLIWNGVPTGIRTRVSALKGPRPRPLDDGDG